MGHQTLVEGHSGNDGATLEMAGGDTLGTGGTMGISLGALGMGRGHTGNGLWGYWEWEDI